MNDLFAYIKKKLYLCSKLMQRRLIMTTLQLNADIYHNLAILSEDKALLDKAAKYIRRLTKQVTDDPTCMPKEEFFARIDEAEKGPTYRMLPNETLDEMLKRLGYV